MKQVKKLLVILPLVALFVLGSLPVLAYDEPYGEKKNQFKVQRFEGKTVVSTETYTEKLTAVLSEKELTATGNASGAIILVKPRLKKLVEEKNSGFEIEEKSFDAAVGELVDAIADAKGDSPYPAKLTKIIRLDKKAEKTSETTTEATTEIKSTGRSIDVVYYENMAGVGTGKEFHRIYNLPADFLQNAIGAGETFEFSLRNLDRVQAAIQEFVESQLQNGYKPIETTYRDAAYTLLNTNDIAIVRMGQEVAKTVKVIAYDIHSNRFVYDRLFELEMNDGWKSDKDASEAFYNNTIDLQKNYLYAGYATRKVEPFIIYRGAYLERIAQRIYIKALDTYKADVVAFVVPRTIDVKTIHTFPEGTRDELIEYVPVPYEVWASLQHSSKFMNLPEIFKTRIQKVNEMGFAFREISYYNGLNPITGLVSGYDWYGFLVAGDGDNDFCARVFYDKAVAAAKEVPTEKKVDAATAPQAQIQAPAAQAPVTAANTTTTTAPANTLPVTGASDSIFLFLSSAALMAVGILFFKKH